MPKPLLTLCALLLSVMSLSAPAGPQLLRLATTTSTENSGLLARLLPPFEQANKLRIQVIAVGTGKALKLGRQGDVDVVMVHARKAELAFVEAGFGVDRREFMFNDFLIVGPADDPAGIAAGSDPLQALRAIADSNALFVSRGDDSGTHKRELSLWRASAGDSKGNGYREVGQGMGRTLQIADEMGAYTLVDRGTWLAWKGRLRLLPMVEGGDRLRNVYGVIALNPERFKDINYAAAKRFIDWLQSPAASAIIDGYSIGGQGLFHSLSPADQTPAGAQPQLAAPRPAAALGETRS